MGLLHDELAGTHHQSCMGINPKLCAFLVRFFCGSNSLRRLHFVVPKTEVWIFDLDQESYAVVHDRCPVINIIKCLPKLYNILT